MEIFEPEEMRVTYKTIKPGEVFKHKALNRYFIKTDYRYNDVDWSINFETGAMSCFRDDEYVIPRKAKVVIE